MPIASLPTGTELYFETHGFGEALLLFPSTAFSGEVWKPFQVPALAPAMRLILHDPRGCPRTKANQQVYTIEQMANDAVALLEKWRLEIDWGTLEQQLAVRTVVALQQQPQQPVFRGRVETVAVPVTVFEASRSLGGRARRVTLDGVDLDNGQHILIGAYRQTLELIARVNDDAPDALSARLTRIPLTIAPLGTAARTTIGSPLLMPPSTPPARSSRRRWKSKPTCRGARCFARRTCGRSWPRISPMCTACGSS